MTPDQFDELVDWVDARWPAKPWHPEQAVAYFDDLARFDPTDVWAAMYGLYEKGMAFAPNGSQIVQAAIAEQRLSKRPDLQALPAPDRRDPTSWDKFSERRFGEVVSGSEAIRRIHAQQKTCGSTRCEVHHPETVDA